VIPPGAADLADWLRLSSLPGVGGSTQRSLLKACGLPGQIFAAAHSTLAAVVGEQAATLLRSPLTEACQAEIEAALAWAGEPGNTILTLADDGYPRSLLTTADPPCLLYAKGDLGLLARPSLAIVGSRNATPGGLQNAARFARGLAGSGYCIVSGMALGIDAAAHEGALAAGGSTIAVIGTGIDRVYPARHQNLARQIVEHGLVVSEFPLGTKPLAANFPRRNRIISGLSLGVLVVEAALESGSLITARLAADQGREVFAIPGSIHSPQTKGCHRLIKQGAKLVESAEDVLEELGPLLQVDLLDFADPTPVASAAGVEKLLGQLPLLGYDPFTIDQLAARSGLTTEALLAMLLELELAGEVAALSGGRYQRLA
jgi:DNA processing protein